MSKNIITISRQFGSGGRTVGKMLSEKLGIPFYDKELVKQVADETGFDVGFIEENGEFSPSKSIFSFAMSQGIPVVQNGLSMSDFIFCVQRQVILKLAEQPCVIVGRGADYILRDREDCFNVFIHAEKVRKNLSRDLPIRIKSVKFITSIIPTASGETRRITISA